MNLKSLFFPLLFITFVAGCNNGDNNAAQEVNYTAYRTDAPIQIDGRANETAWQQAEWYSISERWLGEPFTDEDFSGRFKLSWDEEYLYLLAEITDDSLYFEHEGTERYWDNDILEVFVDEDGSGGEHTYNYNAFAYHIDKNYDVFDIDTDSSAYLYNDHVNVKRTKSGNTYTWETAIRIYDDTYQRGTDNTQVQLAAGKQMGFALAWCDNDTSTARENFIGSEVVEGDDKNRGWIDAGIFGSLLLQE